MRGMRGWWLHFISYPHSCKSRNLLKLNEIPGQARDEGNEAYRLLDGAKDSWLTSKALVPHFFNSEKSRIFVNHRGHRGHREKGDEVMK